MDARNRRIAFQGYIHQVHLPWSQPLFSRPFPAQKYALHTPFEGDFCVGLDKEPARIESRAVARLDGIAG